MRNWCERKIAKEEISVCVYGPGWVVRSQSEERKNKNACSLNCCDLILLTTKPQWKQQLWKMAADLSQDVTISLAWFRGGCKTRNGAEHLSQDMTQ